MPTRKRRNQEIQKRLTEAGNDCSQTKISCFVKVTNEHSNKGGESSRTGGIKTNKVVKVPVRSSEIDNQCTPRLIQLILIGFTVQKISQQMMRKRVNCLNGSFRGFG